MTVCLFCDHYFKIGEIVLDPFMYNEDFNQSYELQGLTEQVLKIINNYLVLLTFLLDLDHTPLGSKLTPDLLHFISLWEAWESLIDNGLRLFDFSLSVDTEIDKNISVTGTGSIKWPRLIKPSSLSVLQFPVTLIGNTSVGHCRNHITVMILLMLFCIVHVYV